MTAKTINRRWWLAVLPYILSTILMATPEEQIIVQRAVGNALYVVIVAKRPLDFGFLATLAKRFPWHGRLSIIRVFLSQQDAQEAILGKGATEKDEHSWLAQYHGERNKRPIALGELIRIDKNSVARIIQDGIFQQKVLEGRNPLVETLGRPDWQIIWMEVGIIPPGQADVYRNPMIHLFVRTIDRVSMEGALRAFGNLRSSFDSPLVTVAFRQDEWFVEAGDFPVIYPFMQGSRDVTLADLNSRYEIGCAGNRQRAGCQAKIGIFDTNPLR